MGIPSNHVSPQSTLNLEKIYPLTSHLLLLHHHSFEYVPFNAGPRICVGQQFALTQMAFVVFRLLQHFKTIERRDERPPVLKFGISTTLLNGCWVSMTPA